jgi:hypothetical protein
MGVVINRDGLPPIHCGSVRELARWFDVLVRDKNYPKTKIDRMASHCLCPIDIQESAKLSGYTAEPDDSCMDYIATKTND